MDIAPLVPECLESFLLVGGSTARDHSVTTPVAFVLPEAAVKQVLDEEAAAAAAVLAEDGRKGSARRGLKESKVPRVFVAGPQTLCGYGVSGDHFRKLWEVSCPAEAASFAGCIVYPRNLLCFVDQTGIVFFVDRMTGAFMRATKDAAQFPETQRAVERDSNGSMAVCKKQGFLSVCVGGTVSLLQCYDDDSRSNNKLAKSVTVFGSLIPPSADGLVLTSCHCAPEAQEIVATGTTGQLFCWDLERVQQDYVGLEQDMHPPHRIVNAHQPWVTLAKFSPSGLRFLTTDAVGGICVWRYPSFECLGRTHLDHFNFACVDWFSSSALLLGMEDGSTFLTELQTEHDALFDPPPREDGRTVRERVDKRTTDLKHVQKYEEGNQTCPSSAAANNTDDADNANADNPGTPLKEEEPLYLPDAPSFHVVHRSMCKMHNAPVHGVAALQQQQYSTTHRGQRIVCWGRDQRVTTARLLSGTDVTSLVFEYERGQRDTTRIQRVCLLRHSGILATTSADSSIGVWSTVNGARIAVLTPPHPLHLRYSCVSGNDDNGIVIAAGTVDGRIVAFSMAMANAVGGGGGGGAVATDGSASDGSAMVSQSLAQESTDSSLGTQQARARQQAAELLNVDVTRDIVDESTAMDTGDVSEAGDSHLSKVGSLPSVVNMIAFYDSSAPGHAVRQVAVSSTRGVLVSLDSSHRLTLYNLLGQQLWRTLEFEEPVLGISLLDNVMTTPVNAAAAAAAAAALRPGRAPRRSSKRTKRKSPHVATTKATTSSAKATPATGKTEPGSGNRTRAGNGKGKSRTTAGDSEESKGAGESTEDVGAAVGALDADANNVDVGPESIVVALHTRTHVDALDIVSGELFLRFDAVDLLRRNMRSEPTECQPWVESDHIPTEFKEEEETLFGSFAGALESKTAATGASTGAATTTIAARAGGRCAGVAPLSSREFLRPQLFSVSTQAWQRGDSCLTLHLSCASVGNGIGAWKLEGLRSAESTSTTPRMAWTEVPPCPNATQIQQQEQMASLHRRGRRHNHSSPRASPRGSPRSPPRASSPQAPPSPGAASRGAATPPPVPSAQEAMSVPPPRIHSKPLRTLRGSSGQYTLCEGTAMSPDASVIVWWSHRYVCSWAGSVSGVPGQLQPEPWFQLTVPPDSARIASVELSKRRIWLILADGLCLSWLLP